MNDRPGIGIGVINGNLFGRQLVAQDVVFDPGEAERTRHVEAGRLEVACDQLHGSNAAGADLGDECLARGEGSLGAPEAEPDGIGKVVDLGGPCGRGVEHPGLGKAVLEENPGYALLRALLGPHGALPACNPAHLVSLVEGDDTVELFTRPADELFKTAVIAACRAQRRIAHEQHALIEGQRLMDLPSRERLDIGSEPAKGRPVTAGIVEQRLVLRDPDRPAAALEPIVENCGGDLSPLPCPGAVAKEEALAVGCAFLVDQ